MGIGKRRGRSDYKELTPPVEVQALREALPLFWPARHYIWDLEPAFKPAYIFAAEIARKGNLLPMAQSYHPSLIELGAAFTSIAAVRPGDAGSVFIRLWWLAIFLKDSPLDQVSDLLVSSGQSSPDWADVIAAAAEVRGRNSDAEIDRDRFYAALLGAKE